MSNLEDSGKINSEVLKMGNPLLRKKSVELDIEMISSPKTQELIDLLINTMRTENGAGIAAPQIGQLQRIFIIECDNNPRYPEKSTFPLTVVINPIITPISDEKIDSWEGCLSIPGIRGKLPRYSKVLLTGLDREGKEYSKEITDFEAVVAQHELDHLDGILFIDRMPDMTFLTFRAEYEEYWRL